MVAIVKKHMGLKSHVYTAKKPVALRGLRGLALKECKITRLGHKKYQVAESSLKPVGKIVQSFILSKVPLDQISRLTSKKPY